MRIEKEILKIAITGPESTGKSSISAYLAEQYHSAFVPEYSRKYLTKLKSNYKSNDIVFIAEKQLHRENLVERCVTRKSTLNKIIFCDTELINIKIWLEDKGWSVPQWIEEEIKKDRYVHYLLMDNSLEWTEDSLRENETKGAYFFEKFEANLLKYHKNYSIITGVGEERKKNATAVINKIIFDSK
jgi:nicotinamide riboside kinase